MKKLIFALCALCTLVMACGDSSSKASDNPLGDSSSTTSDNPLIEQATKRIRQDIDAKGMGMLKDFKVYDVEQLNDSMFRATREFTNPMIEKEIKITADYTFDSELNTIINSETVKSYMKSEGEWVEAGF